MYLVYTIHQQNYKKRSPTPQFIIILIIYSYNLFICDVDSIYTNILLVVFIQCFYLFCDYIWTVSLQ